MKADVVAGFCRPFAGNNFTTGCEVPLGKQNLLSSATTLFESNASANRRWPLFLAIFAIVIAVVTALALRIW